VDVLLTTKLNHVAMNRMGSGVARAVGVLALGAAVSTSGCGMAGGRAMYMAGLFRRPTIDAEFRFGKGPIAVVVDDFGEVCYWPGVSSALAERLILSLESNKAAKTIISNAAVNRLRKTDASFDEHSCARLGRLLGAEQVLLIEIRSFYASENPAESNAAARLGVAAKVINVLEKTDRRKVRLWPKSRDGRIVTTELSANDVSRAKTREGVLRELTTTAADNIVNFFHDRAMGDFE